MLVVGRLNVTSRNKNNYFRGFIYELIMNTLRILLRSTYNLLEVSVVVEVKTCRNGMHDYARS